MKRLYGLVVLFLGITVMLFAQAEYSNGKYWFDTKDSWGNKVFGSVSVKDEELILFLDCEEFSENGKDLARLYGDTHIMKREPVPAL